MMNTEELSERITKSDRIIFMRSDLNADDSAIEQRLKRGAIVSLAPGVYAKARTSSVDGEPVPAASPERILRKVADRMEVKIKESAGWGAYYEGRSTQIPDTDGAPSDC